MNYRLILPAAALFAATGFTSAPAVADDWTDRLSFKGDFRLRYEGIDIEGNPSRDRFRFRTRFDVTAEVRDDIDFVLGWSTGGDNPVSANTTIDGGFNKDEFRLNLAYVTWAVSDELTVLAGKMKNPAFRPGKSQLIWDNDVTPEGAALVFERGALFGNLSALAVEERSTDDDSYLFSFQGGTELELDDNASLTVGLGYLSYSNTVGFEPFYNGSAKGNSVDAGGNYIYDYRTVELFAQYDTVIDEWPLQVYGHFARNSDADTDDTGFAIGAKLGSAKNQGTQQFNYVYQDVEADAVVATFNDSNFGAGGTDADGHILRYKYALRDNVTLGGSLFVNSTSRFQGIERDHDRIQIDLEFKFN